MQVEFYLGNLSTEKRLGIEIWEGGKEMVKKAIYRLRQKDW
jgi:hypothetical protein